MRLDQGPSWRQRSWPQPVNSAQDLSEQSSLDGDLRHLERDVATMADNFGPDLDLLLAQSGQRPVLDLLRQGQCTQEVAEIVSERLHLGERFDCPGLGEAQQLFDRESAVGQRGR